jgi:hypothetical protein
MPDGEATNTDSSGSDGANAGTGSGESGGGTGDTGEGQPSETIIEPIELEPHRRGLFEPPQIQILRREEK